jgi:hypothetical protein
MTILEYGIQPRPASNLRRLAWATPYVAVLLGLYGFSSAWAAVLLYQAGTLAFMMAIRDNAWRRRFRGWNARWAIVLAVFGATGGLLLHLLWPWLHLEERLSPALSELGVSESGTPVFLLYFALLIPWSEELLWRDYLAGTSRWPDIGDLLFAAYHPLVLRLFLGWPWVVLATAILVLAGWLWRQLAARFGGLLLPVLSHLIADVSVVIVVLARA